MAAQQNYLPDFTLFWSEDVAFPDCSIIQVEPDGDNVVKATPVWIDNLKFTYGGFGPNYEDGQYISGRQEWGDSRQLQVDLTEEAKARAFELYPDRIVDYYVDPYLPSESRWTK